MNFHLLNSIISVYSLKKQLKEWMMFLLLGIFALIFIFPMIFTISNSFMTEEEITENYMVENRINPNTSQKNFMNMKLIPDEVTIKQYDKILIQKPKYLFMFWNSIIIALPITLGQVIVSIMAAYAFSINRTKGKEILFFIYIIVMLMPYQVTLVPNYIIAEKLKLIGSYLSIIFPGIFNTYGVFLLRQYMKNIPNACIEASRIDGANGWQIFWHIVFPLSKTAVATLALLTFIDNWNMVEQPLVFLKDSFKQPLSTYLTQINQGEKGIAFASAVFYMLPMLLIFLYCEKYFVEGIQHSGIKG